MTLKCCSHSAKQKTVDLIVTRLSGLLNSHNRNENEMKILPCRLQGREVCLTAWKGMASRQAQSMKQQRRTEILGDRRNRDQTYQERSKQKRLTCRGLKKLQVHGAGDVLDYLQWLGCWRRSRACASLGKREQARQGEAFRGEARSLPLNWHDWEEELAKIGEPCA